MNQNQEERREWLFSQYDASGANVFDDSELLELLLAYTAANEETIETVQRLLAAFGSLKMLLGAAPQDIQRFGDVEESTAVLLAMISPLAGHMKALPSSGTFLLSVEDAGEYAISLFAHEKMESFYVLFLDQRKRLLATEHVGRGTIDEVPIYPRQIADLASKYKCRYVILTHNHPTGLLSASSNDYAATAAIRVALEETKVRVLDHIIIGDGRYYSFAEKQIL